MTNVKVLKNQHIRDNIMTSAPAGRLLKSTDPHMTKADLAEWRALTSAVRTAIGLYGEALSAHSESAVALSRKAFFDALSACREYGGFTFVNGVGASDECELWLARLTRVVRIKDSTGKIIDAPLSLASPDTVRKQIELMLCLRESGTIGMTIAQYEEYKAAKKAAKKAARMAKQALPAPSLDAPAMPMPAPKAEIA